MACVETEEDEVACWWRCECDAWNLDEEAECASCGLYWE
jgi:hypothetical protein